MTAWSREDDIAFERALASYTDESEDKWEKIAADVPGKSVEQIKEHYEVLVEDVSRIESGCVPLPAYNSPRGGSGGGGDDGGSTKKGGNSHVGESKAKSDQERRKGIAWTEDEHRCECDLCLFEDAHLFAEVIVCVLQVVSSWFGQVW